MTDLQYRKQKKRVHDLVKKWKTIIGLNGYKIHLTWDRSYSEHRGRAAETNMNGWKYKYAQITFYLPAVMEEEDDIEVESLVVHELCHVLLGPISCNMDDLNNHYQQDLMELNTEMVAQALLWSREAGRRAKV